MDKEVETLDWPLMQGNISKDDLNCVVKYLMQDDPMLTQSSQVREFEQEWSAWLGVKRSVFVNSGSSANLLTLSALKHLVGDGEIIVPTLTWVSDIASVIQCGFKPVFVDINFRNLGANTEEIIRKISPQTKAVFLTHILGYNALSQDLLDALAQAQVPLIEDVCESYGATYNDQKLGAYGWASNFSFYYAHHMSTIEGGMISTNDEELYQVLRMLRSHGMVRETTSELIKEKYQQQYSDLNPDFIFAYPAYNVRSTEINALIGRSQLKRLDQNNAIRSENLKLFLEHLDSEKYFTDFDLEGSCNYAFTLVLRHPDECLCQRVMDKLTDLKVEFRRGTSGGGNQLRQPYLRNLFGDFDLTQFPNVDHVHFYGFYIGNYPDLDQEKIMKLCSFLNEL